MPNKGTSTERGYNYQHRKLRKQYEPVVHAGRATCWRCHEPITPDEPWDLGHRDGQPQAPEHQACNRATAGRERAMSTQHVDTSRNW